MGSLCSSAKLFRRTVSRSVLMNPGLMALTRTPSLTPRSASAFVNSRAAALTLPPIVKSALPVRPPTPMMLTIVPLLAIRCFQAARLRRIAPKNFSANPSVPVGVGELEEIAALGGAGVVDQQIDPAEFRDSGVHDGRR